MLYLTEDIPTRTRTRAKILYDFGYLTQSTVDSLSTEELISLVDTLHLRVHSDYGMTDQNR